MSKGLPVSDSKRLTELHRYETLDTLPEEAFERLVSLTQQLFKVPIVLISLVSEDRQWVKARRGTDLCEVGLESSMCRHTVEQQGVMVILDLTEDVRFCQIPLVTDDPFIRFYVGAPLTTPRGYNVGTLCLIDAKPHDEFSDEAKKTLMDLAALVVDELELQVKSREAERASNQTATILESITEAFYTLDRGWCFTYVNAQAEKLLRRSKAELLGREVWAEFPETEGSILYQHYFQAAATGVAAAFEYYYPPLSTWFEVHTYPSSEGMSIYFQDINERKTSEQRLLVQAEFRRDLLAFTQTSLQNELGEHFYQSLLENAVRTIPGAQAGSLLVRKGDKHHFAAAVGFDLEALRACVFDFRDETQFEPNRLEPQLVTKWKLESFTEEQRSVLLSAGRTKDIKGSLCVPIAVNGRVEVILYLDNFETSYAFDSEAVEMTRVLALQAATLMQRLDLDAALRSEREALARAAHFDALTGLPNRLLLNDRLKQALEHARRYAKPLAVIFLDLDHFKYVNDRYGHSIGDALIAAAGARITPLLREGDTLARWGGDEFVGIFPNLASAEAATGIAKRILKAVEEPFMLAGLQLRVSASIGVVHCLDGLTDAEELLKHADIALYQAKRERGGFHVFSESMRRSLRQRAELGDELRAALKSNALTLHYQPRVRLADGRITSVEALARWRHPEKGWIPPDTFIPIAEELGLIGPLGAQMLNLACTQAKAWQRARTPCRIAVNMSVEQIKQHHIVEGVRQVLNHYKLAPKLLELEITETTAMADVEESVKKLHAFRDMGIHLSIDDFGTAYSSLAYLKELPIQTLKIDRSFVRDISAGADAKDGDIRIVQAIIALAKSLNLCLIAEGIETEYQYRILKKLGCDEAQGYFFAPPLPAENIETQLKTETLFRQNFM